MDADKGILESTIPFRPKEDQSDIEVCDCVLANRFTISLVTDQRLDISL